MQTVLDLLDSIPTQALAIVKMMKILTNTDAPCRAEDITALKAMKTSAKAKAENAVNKFNDTIAAADNKYNAAVAAIEAINAKLMEIGATPFAPPTAAQPVATVEVVTEAATAGSTTFGPISSNPMSTEIISSTTSSVASWGRWSRWTSCSGRYRERLCESASGSGDCQGEQKTIECEADDSGNVISLDVNVLSKVIIMFISVGGGWD